MYICIIINNKEKYYEEGIKICNSERSTYKWNISKDVI